MVKGLCAYGFKMFVVFSVFVVSVSGCDQQSAKPVATVNDSMDSPILTELSAHWLEAAKYLTLASPEKSSELTTLQYSETAACALVYDFEVTTTTTVGVTDTKPGFRNKPQTQQLLGRFELRPETAPYTQLPAWRLHSRQLGQYTVRNEIRLPGKESKDGDYPDVLLQNTGDELQPAESESQLWSQLHPFGGLSQFFPRLPAVRLSDSGKAQPVQAASKSPELRITEHLSINHEPAVVMVATDEQFTARYIVLNSGRLLHAVISRSAKIPSEHGEFIRTQVSEARLTGACEEPTLPPIGFKTSRVRNALDTYTRLVFAVHGGQSERALPYLSQDLIDAHGADNILAMLREHIGQYGITALGDPNLVDPVEVDGEFLRFRVVGRAENANPESESPVTIVNYIVIEDSESGMHVLSIASTTNQAPNQATKDSNMLEISPRRIFTASRSKTP